MFHSASTRAVAFRIYDLDDTGSINQGEVQRLLAALLADNPALDLDEGAIQKIVQQVRSLSGVCTMRKKAWHRVTDGIVSCSAKTLLRLPALTRMKRQVMQQARSWTGGLHHAEEGTASSY